MSRKENVEVIKKLAELDDVAAKAGGFVDLNSNIETEPHYNYQEINKYCKEKGIEPLDMTLRELNQFIIQ